MPVRAPLCVCVCVRARACVRVSVCACACIERERERGRERDRQTETVRQETETERGVPASVPREAELCEFRLYYYRHFVDAWRACMRVCFSCWSGTRNAVFVV